MLLRSIVPLAATMLAACDPALSRATGDFFWKADCRYVSPAELPAGARSWYGKCTAKAAHGPGVLRAANAAFYGTMIKGRPFLGALEDGSGVRLGRFVGRRFVQSDKSQDNLDSSRAAAAGARTAAARLARANYRGLANEYAAKARMFGSYDH